MAMLVITRWYHRISWDPGIHHQLAMELSELAKWPIEIVDLPIDSMVIFPSVFCKRLRTRSGKWWIFDRIAMFEYQRVSVE
jgi:hypothetical protein